MRGIGRTAAAAVMATVLIAAVAAPAAAQQPPEAAGGYGDVQPGSTHEADISELADAGVFEGTECEDGFCPSAPIPRWTMAVWLVRIVDGGDVSGPSRFADVPSDAWWAGYVERLAELDITGGCATEPARFCPTQTVTRAQMATFLVQAFDLPAAPRADFEDVAEGSTHAAHIDALAASGVTAGCGERRYCPAQNTTRAQMATFLNAARSLEPEPEVEPAVVPTDGSAVTIPAGSPFVAAFETVTVEGGVGVFDRETKIRLSETTVGADEHSRFEALAAPPIEIDFGGAEIVGPLTFRFRSDTSGLKPEYVVPAVWSQEIMAWVPTLGDRVIIGQGEIIVKVAPISPAAASATVPGDFRDVAVATGGPTLMARAPTGEVLSGGDAGLRSVADIPCWLAPLQLKCLQAAGRFVYTALVPAAWQTATDAALALVGSVVDLGTDVVAAAREYVPKVMDAIESGIKAGLNAALAFYERWVLPRLRDFIGIGTDPPHCVGASAPLWVADDGIDFSEASRHDPRLRMCSEAAAPEGSLSVKAVNNRNFGYQLDVADSLPIENLQAEASPDANLTAALVNDANQFLIDQIDGLDRYHWPLRELSFEVPEIDDSWTGRWIATGPTALLDIIRLGSSLVTRAVNHIPVAGFALDATECVAPLTGEVEAPDHWTQTFDTVGSCYSAAATVALGTGAGAPLAVALEAAAQVLEAAVSAAKVAELQLTQYDLRIDRLRGPASLSIRPVDCDADPPDNRPDLDGDGIIDFCDDDQDGDGWLDEYDTDDRDGPDRGATRGSDNDWDGDDVPHYLDRDQDNDGAHNDEDTDDDGDGIDDVCDADLDRDGDTDADLTDLDRDGNGTLDECEDIQRPTIDLTGITPVLDVRVDNPRPTVGDKVTIIATVTDAEDGTPLAGADLDFIIDGESRGIAYAKTNGQARITRNGPTGPANEGGYDSVQVQVLTTDVVSRPIGIFWQPDESRRITISVSPDSSHSGKTRTITAQVVDGTTPMAGQSVELHIDGVFVGRVPTGSDGVATFTRRSQVHGPFDLAKVVLAADSSVASNEILISWPMSARGSHRSNNWEFVWSDEFNGTSLDSAKWRAINNCPPVYLACDTDRPENVDVSDGMLRLRSLREPYAGTNKWTGSGSQFGPLTSYTQGDFLQRDFTAGRVDSAANFTYGRFELLGKLPQGHGTFFAFWMRPRNSPYGNDAAGGEIDIAEGANIGRGGNRRGQIDAQLPGDGWGVHHVVHMGYPFTNPFTLTNLPVNPAESFHLYAVEWDTASIRFYVDDQRVLTVPQGDWFSHPKDSEEPVDSPYAPFDQPFFIVINNTVGNWALETWPGNQVPDTTVFPAEFVVDYMRVYECRPPSGTGVGGPGQGCETP